MWLHQARHHVYSNLIKPNAYDLVAEMAAGSLEATVKGLIRGLLVLGLHCRQYRVKESKTNSALKCLEWNSQVNSFLSASSRCISYNWFWCKFVNTGDLSICTDLLSSYPLFLQKKSYH